MKVGFDETYRRLGKIPLINILFKHQFYSGTTQSDKVIIIRLSAAADEMKVGFDVTYRRLGKVPLTNILF